MYRNVLMLHCRRTMKYSPRKVAGLLGMSRATYEDLECGNILLNYALAKKLAELYNTRAQYFFEAAQQLDLLLSNRLVIRILKAENDRLQADVTNLKEALHRDKGSSFTS